MNLLGVILLLIGMTAVGIGAWIALEQRLGWVTKLRRRFPVLGKNPWLVVAVMTGAVLVIGAFMLAARAPEALYYVIGGLMVATVLSLVTVNNRE